MFVMLGNAVHSFSILEDRNQVRKWLGVSVQSFFFDPKLEYCSSSYKSVHVLLHWDIEINSVFFEYTLNIFAT